MSELGLCGLKLGPIYQNIHPHDPRIYRVYGAAQELKIPILIHQGAAYPRNAPLEYAQPVLLERVALDFPDLKIVIAHLGHPWEAETIVLVRKQPNVFADISALFYRPWQFYNSMRLADEYGVLKSILARLACPLHHSRADNRTAARAQLHAPPLGASCDQRRKESKVSFTAIH